MRILLVADIHSNWPALAAIDEPFDRCLFLGDLVDYGPQPSECIAWVQQHATLAVKGNHDHGVAQDVAVHVNGSVGGFKWLTARTRTLSRQRTTTAERRYLHELPSTVMGRFEGNRYLLVHATPRDPLDEVVPADADAWAKRLEHVDADIVCVGHTHQQFVMHAGGKLIINPGSVGLPREGDPRAAYAVVDGGRVEMRRVDYDIEATCRAVRASGLADDVAEALCTVYRTGSLSRIG